MNVRTFRTLALTLLLVPACWGQGAGLVGSNGLEPRVQLSGRQAGAPTVLSVADLAPQGGAPSLLLTFSLAPGFIDLAPAGLSGAAVGLDLTTAAFLPLLVVSPAGTVDLPFTVPASFAGMTIFAQALALDAGAPVGGLALSDAVALSFGNTDVTAITSTGAAPNAQAIGRLFGDLGTTAPVLPDLQGIEILDVLLNSSFDTLALRHDVPVRDGADPARPRVRLPDGGALYRYQTAAGAHGIFLVRNSGQDFHHLIEIPGVLEAEIGVSAHEPIAAVSAANPVPALGGAQLFLLRTDGSNFPGTASPLRAIPFTGSLAAYVPEPCSASFMQGALLLSDKQQLVRIPTDLATPPAMVSLPSSGGLVPVDVDEEFVIAADGQTAAFTAGQNANLRDVYVVHPTGPAINVTQSPGEYADANLNDPEGGGRLALSPDGSRVAYILKVPPDEDVFVRDTVPAGPLINLTPPALFGNSLEAESGILLASRTLMTFTNGNDENTKDLFAAALPQAATGPVAVTNLTMTSGLATPPFNQGGALRLVGRAALPGGGALYRLDSGPGTPEVLVRTDGTTGGSTVLASQASLGAVAHSPAGALVAINDATGGQVLRLDPTGTTTLLTTPAGQQVTGLATDSASAPIVAIVASGSGETAMLIAPSGVSTPISGGPGSAISRSMGFLADGSLLLNGGGQIYVVDGLTGLVSATTPVTGFVQIY